MSLSQQLFYEDIDNNQFNREPQAKSNTIEEHLHDDSEKIDDDEFDRRLIEVQAIKKNQQQDYYQNEEERRKCYKKNIHNSNNEDKASNNDRLDRNEYHEELRYALQRVHVRRDVDVVGYLPGHQFMKESDRQNHIFDAPMSKQLLAICRHPDYTEAEALLQLKAMCHCFNMEISVDITATPIAEVVDAVTRMTIKDAAGLDCKSLLNLTDSLVDMNTALHVASYRGFTRVVSFLLQLGADPTIVDTKNRPAYYLCKDRHTRDVFREFRSKNTVAFDWFQSGVPISFVEAMNMNCLKKGTEKKTKKEIKEKNESKNGRERKYVRVPGEKSPVTP